MAPDDFSFRLKLQIRAHSRTKEEAEGADKGAGAPPDHSRDKEGAICAELERGEERGPADPGSHAGVKFINFIHPVALEVLKNLVHFLFSEISKGLDFSPLVR